MSPRASLRLLLRQEKIADYLSEGCFPLSEIEKQEQTFLTTWKDLISAKETAVKTIEHVLKNSPSDNSASEDFSDDEGLGNCLWETEEADLYIRTVSGTSLFPVHKSILSAYSSVFHMRISELFRNNDDPLCNNEQSTDQVNILNIELNTQDTKELLAFIYSRGRRIDDTNVLRILRLADEFMISSLKSRCETFLLENSQLHPLELVETADKFNLDKLLRYSVTESAKIPGISRRGTFKKLDPSLQMRIKQRVKKPPSSKRNISYYKSSIPTNSCSLRREYSDDLYDADSEDESTGEQENFLEMEQSSIHKAVELLHIMLRYKHQRKNDRKSPSCHIY